VTGRYAAALSCHPVPAVAVGEAAGEVLERLDGARPDLLVVFASPHLAGAFDDVVGSARRLLEPDVTIGATAVAVAGGAREIEEGPAVALFAAACGEGAAAPVRLVTTAGPDGLAVHGMPDGAAGTLVLLADPFSIPVADVLRRAGDAGGPVVLGGLASSARAPGGNRLALDDAVLTDGAVGALLDPSVPVRPVVSQGCRPVGRPFTITAADGNVVAELGGRPALSRLEELVAAASEAERALLRGGVHVGLVVDEHRVEFHRGDFLVRNLLGADRSNGALAVGEEVQVGQTLQFHVRDAAAADEDLRALLAGAAADAVLLFTCNGRGARFFGVADHDAGVVDELLGPLPLAGAFCAGEIGPVGGRSHLHGFTASMALFA
jgi:small ligand-binding sensory domain FIST